MKEGFMNKIIVVALATAALCVPVAAQQPSGQLPRQLQPTNDPQEMQRIISEEKQDVAENQGSPDGAPETTGQGYRATQMQATNDRPEMQRIIGEERQELAEDQGSPNGALETTGQGSRTGSG